LGSLKLASATNLLDLKEFLERSVTIDLDLSIADTETLSPTFLSRIYLSILPVLKLSIAAGNGSFSS
jgi:hypothetical protein